MTDEDEEERIVRSEDISTVERERRIAESLARLDAMTDDDIDLSDIPEITDWSNAIRGWFSDSPQVEIRLRIDRDVLRWILHRHGEFQTAINVALREHVEREREQ
jgi:uncharacterized protein (DUF4415 family)